MFVSFYISGPQIYMFCYFEAPCLCTVMYYVVKIISLDVTQIHRHTHLVTLQAFSKHYCFKPNNWIIFHHLFNSKAVSFNSKCFFFLQKTIINMLIVFWFYWMVICHNFMKLFVKQLFSDFYDISSQLNLLKIVPNRHIIQRNWFLHFTMLNN